MKLKTTIFSMFVCLLAFSFSAKALDPCEYQGQTNAGPTNDYTYVMSEVAVDATHTDVYITFVPKVAGVSAIAYYTPGYNALSNNVPLKIGTFAPGTTLPSAYILFTQSGGGENNNVTKPYNTYVVGTCSGSGTTNTKPAVEITGFEPSNGLVAPETILLTATATDADGTITKVEFFNGTTSIGVGTAGTGNQYNLLWTNVNPGTYNNITAKATDDKSGTTTSDPFPSFTVTGEFTNEWCGTSVNGDYQWRAETVGTSVTYTIHPTGTVATGINNPGNPHGPGPYAIIYPYGTYMAPVSGTNDLTYTATGIAPGTNIEFYVTYNYYGVENNSSANKEHYTSGTQCAMSTLPVSLVDFKSKTQADGTVALSWATTSENNNNHFVIERSSDNSNFVALDKIASKGTNSQSRLNYSFTDKNPVNGTNYYRLSQVDNNGNVQVLGIVAETVSLNSLSAIYPNPLHGTTLNLSLAGQQDGQVAVDVSTLAGKVIYSGTAQIAGGQGSVSLSSKPTPGLYLVKVGEKSFKLIVE